MNDPQTPADPTAPATSTVDLAQPTPLAWTVKFVVPAPESMPSDRMKARAELVRSAGGCDMCGGSSY